ncbi:MAG: hypothetical protein V2J62_05705 [candidate division KSB1 bacterium]|jgi:hypothetical protein|nr:hypothetical protein [candidate division KSB1 bacterium]
MTRRLVLDGHVHIYPFYDLHKAVQSGIRHLTAAYQNKGENRGVLPVWLLSERSDCQFFQQTAKSLQSGEFVIEKTEEEESLAVTRNGETVLYIIAGRQIVSTDALEVISIASTCFLEDRKADTAGVIDYVNEQGGVPVLNWAPGKWFFKRGDIVENLLEAYDPEKLLFGDTSLRTRLWRTPALMKKAINSGYKVIAGSDPLPFKDEEEQIGRYGFTMTGEFDMSLPAASIRNMLRDSAVQIDRIGERNRLLSFATRQFKIMREK